MTNTNAVTTTDQVKQSLKKRYRKEKTFKLFGQLSILFGFIVVIILIGDITRKALPAFHQHWVKIDVEYSKDWLGVTSTEPEVLLAANYRKALKRSVYGMFPQVKKRKDKKRLFKLLSGDAEYSFRNNLIETPSLLGQKMAMWVMLDDDVDSYLKEDFASGEAGGRLNEKQAVWLQTLDERGLIETRFNTGFFTNSDSREPEQAGVRGALAGTMLTMLVTLVLSFPLGVAAALYLEEFAPRNRWTDMIEININNLAAVPSIVFGLLGLAVIINIFGLPRSAPMVGGIVLTLMTLPTIIIASRASIKAVPPSIREAAMGLGASKMQVAFGHVLPMAMPGILTGAIIGMAQALGETAPLLMIGMVAFIVDVPTSITDAATVLPVQIFLWADSPERAFMAKTSAAILVLLGLLAVMNISAAMLRRYFERNR
jgi:phosphate transport system permease protein